MTAAIASKLAADVITGLELISIRSTTLAGHPGSSRIVIEAMNEVSPRAKGRRVWLSSRRQADKILGEIFASDRRSRRSADDLIIEAAADEAEQLVRQFGQLNGYDVTDDAEIEAIKARVIERISAAIDRLQRDGRLKHVNQAYKALGPSRPPYNAFLTEQLRCMTAQLHPADLRSLRARI